MMACVIISVVNNPFDSSRLRRFVIYILGFAQPIFYIFYTVGYLGPFVASVSVGQKVEHPPHCALYVNT